MLNIEEHMMILRFYKKGFSIRKINKTLGYSRDTIRKALAYQIPNSCKLPHKQRTSQKASNPDDFKDYILSRIYRTEISSQLLYNEIKHLGYTGSLRTINAFLRTLPKSKKRYNKYNGIRNQEYCAWMHDVLQKNVSCEVLEKELPEQKETIRILYNIIHKAPLKKRNRALAILAYLKQIPRVTIASFLCVQRSRIRNYISLFEKGGIDTLFNFQRKALKKYDQKDYQDAVFRILHTPPSTYNINRTTWRMEDLCKTLKNEGFPICAHYMRHITKKPDIDS